MKTPAISIVMPVYNAARYLPETMESVLTQTFSDFELIIVNDGCTDDSVDIIKSYNDGRIVLMENRHDFIRSLNRGIGKSQGKYIARMDADDIMLPKRLSVQYEFMEAHPGIDICGSWMETFGGNVQTAKMPSGHEDIVRSLLFGNAIFHPTAFMRKSSLEKCKSYPNLYKSKYIYAEDYKLWIDLVKNRLVFANIPKVLLWYRISNIQVSYRHREKQAGLTHLIRSQFAEYLSGLIIREAPGLYCYLNSSIQLVNEGRLSCGSFSYIVSDLYVDLWSDSRASMND
ncbi:MAG: glycosyltransferase [Prevotella sp.]|jgi:glycosyltransferase involved in cell wall biosynthesis|nr:glycosyltransferase [Prevotella sp.]